MGIIDLAHVERVKNMAIPVPAAVVTLPAAISNWQCKCISQ